LHSFISTKIYEYGGIDLLNSVKIQCTEDIIIIETEKPSLVHAALFFTGMYFTIKCKIDRIN